MDPAAPNAVFNVFHQVERELFKILAVYLCRSPTESMQVVALWLWLERNPTLGSFMHRLVGFPYTIIFAVVEETAKCLHFLQGGQIAGDEFEIPLIEMLIERNIPLHIFQHYSIGVAEGINGVLITVCGRAFYDLMLIVHQINTAAQQIVPTLSGDDQKSMFLNFSRGRPVPEFALLNYLTVTYGDNIIQSLVMQQVGANLQPMFAKVIFNDKATVQNILQGRSQVKFIIGGNPVWARKLVPIRQIEI
ncbi:hypothetical protein ACFE04_014575 [Oxalis oulophora]